MVLWHLMPWLISLSDPANIGRENWRQTVQDASKTCEHFAIMNHDHLRILIEVAQQRSFSAVAKRRDMDPSAVSRIVQAIEKELGVRLFQRSTRQVALTEAGSLYLARVSHLLEELDAASDELKSSETQPKGTLRVTASVAFGQSCLIPLVPGFLKAHPGISLELLLTDINVDLISERVDLALRVSPRMAQDMIRVKWFESDYRLCAAPGYFSRENIPDSLDELSAHHYVLFGYPQPQSVWRIQDKSGSEQKVTVNAAVVASNGLAQLDLAIAGVGPALMPYWLAGPALKSGKLIEWFSDYSVNPLGFEGAAWILYPNRSFLPAKTRLFIDYLKRTKPELSWT
jgi:DNA-binding transcriptional LysR family regulator